MKKIIVFAFFCGVLGFFSTASAQVFTVDEATAEINAIKQSGKPEEAQIADLQALEDATKTARTTFQQRVDDANEAIQKGTKDIQDQIDRYKAEIKEIDEVLNNPNSESDVTIPSSGITYTPTPGSGRGVSVRTKLSQRRTEVNTLIETAETELEIAKTNLEPSFDQAKKDLSNIDQALGKIKSERISIARGLSVQESVKKIQSINEQSNSFNTGDHLSVGGERNLHLDSGAPEDTFLLNRILVYLVQLVGTFAVIMMIVGGTFMITAEGDDNRLQKGKNIFIYTILGLLVVFSSYALIQFVLSVLFQ